MLLGVEFPLVVLMLLQRFAVWFLDRSLSEEEQYPPRAESSRAAAYGQKPLLEVVVGVLCVMWSVEDPCS